MCHHTMNTGSRVSVLQGGSQLYICKVCVRSSYFCACCCCARFAWLYFTLNETAACQCLAIVIVVDTRLALYKQQRILLVECHDLCLKIKSLKGPLTEAVAVSVHSGKQDVCCKPQAAAASIIAFSLTRLVM